MEGLFKTTQAYRLIEEECVRGYCSHAYLLLCDDGKNLRKILKIFAKLFFTEGDKERIGKLIDAENFADCLFYPRENKKLTVEDAESIREESMLSPVEGRRKLFVLSDFAEANPQTQNKLLKLLEEPPEGVHFLLGATSAFPVLPTVRSRTKKVEILPFQVEETVACMRRMYQDRYDTDTLTLCSAASGGVLGEAQSMLEGGYYRTLLGQAFGLVLAEAHHVPQAVQAVGETKRKKELLALLRIIFRDATLLKMGGVYAKKVFLSAEKDRLIDVASKYTKSQLLYAQEVISDAEQEIQFNAIFGQCLEVCLAKINKK